MKKLLIGLLAAISHISVSQAQEVDTVKISEEFAKVGAQLGDVVETTFGAFGSILETVTDEMTKVLTMAKVCNDEDKKNSALTLAQINNIAQAIMPKNSGSIKINTMGNAQEKFLTNSFNQDGVDFDVELTKSYCLVWLDEMMMPLQNMPEKINNTVEENMKINGFAKQQDLSDEDITQESQSYTIVGDNIEMDKFNKITINNAEIKIAWDEAKQNAYAFSIIGMLAIKVKAHGENAQTALKQFFEEIDTDLLKQTLGNQTNEEIKNYLNEKYQSALQEQNSKAN